MKVTEVLDKLEHSPEFLEWKKDRKNAYLTSLFIMFDDELTDEWLVNYYDASDKKVTTFAVSRSGCERKGEEQSDTPAKQLEAGKVKVELDEAAATAKTAFETRTGEKSTKTIAILHNLEPSHVWNISYMSASFNIYNVKVDAETGMVSSESYGALFRPL